MQPQDYVEKSVKIIACQERPELEGRCGNVRTYEGRRLCVGLTTSAPLIWVDVGSVELISQLSTPLADAMLADMTGSLAIDAANSASGEAGEQIAHKAQPKLELLPFGDAPGLGGDIVAGSLASTAELIKASAEVQMECIQILNSGADSAGMAERVRQMQGSLSRSYRAYTTWQECSAAIWPLAPGEAETLSKLLHSGVLAQASMSSTRNLLHTNAAAIEELGNNLFLLAKLPPRQAVSCGVEPNKPANHGHAEIVVTRRVLGEAAAACVPCGVSDEYFLLTSRIACSLCAAVGLASTGLASLLGPGRRIISVDRVGASRADIRSRQPSAARLVSVQAESFEQLGQVAPPPGLPASTEESILSVKLAVLQQVLRRPEAAAVAAALGVAAAGRQAPKRLADDGGGASAGGASATAAVQGAAPVAAAEEEEEEEAAAMEDDLVWFHLWAALVEQNDRWGVAFDVLLQARIAKGAPLALDGLPAALAAQLRELDDTQRSHGPSSLYAALTSAPAAWWAAAAEAGLISCELADSLGEAAVREGLKQAAMSAYRNAAFIELCTAAGADHGVLLALRDSRDYRSYSWMTSLVIEILVKARATKGAPLELDGLEAALASEVLALRRAIPLAAAASAEAGAVHVAALAASASTADDIEAARKVAGAAAAQLGKARAQAQKGPRHLLSAILEGSVSWWRAIADGGVVSIELTDTLGAPNSDQRRSLRDLVQDAVRQGSVI